LNDLKSQLQQMRKLGGMQGVLAMLPGVGKLKSQLKDAKLDDAILKRQEAIIGSMTPHERANPKIIAASRKRRIAAGSGTSVADVNKLLKMHQQMGGMMKRMKKMGKRGIAPGMLPPGMENLIPRR
jgi:signal recognition particle subunit SRP54